MDIRKVYLSPSEDGHVKQNSAIRQILENLANLNNTLAGTLGGGQFRGFLGGLTLSNDGSSPNTVLDIAAGVCCSDDQTTLLQISAFTKTTSSWASGTANGGLDTGSVANSTWYHVYVIGGTNVTTDVLFSTSASSPTMPSNYTVKRRIGSFLTDGSAHIVSFYQTGDEFLWKVPVIDVNGVNVSTTQSLYTLTVPLGIAVSALHWDQLTYVSATDGVGVYSPVIGAQGANTWITGDFALLVKATSTVSAAWKYTRTNTNSQIAAAASGGTGNFYVATVGWIDRRGRDD